MNTLTVLALAACVAIALAQTGSGPINSGDPSCSGQCNPGETGCSLNGGQCGCCPYDHGDCCQDHAHCCPQGYACDIPDGQCIQGGLVKNVFMPKVLPLGKVAHIKQIHQ